MTPTAFPRRLRPELMDQPKLDPARHRAALAGLARLNALSRSARVLAPPVLELAKSLGRPVRVLDVASGGGDVLFDLETIVRRAGFAVEIHGRDLSETAITVARETAAARRSAATFSQGDALADPLPEGFDAVTCSLFLHHLTDDNAVTLLGRMKDAAGRMVVVNDLARGRVGWWLAAVTTRIVTRSDVVHVDGPRSVEGAFTADEVAAMAERAGLTGAVVTPHWPCRYRILWTKGGAA